MISEVEPVGSLAQGVGRLHVGHVTVIEQQVLQLHARLADALGERRHVDGVSIGGDRPEEARLWVGRCIAANRQGRPLGAGGIIVPVGDARPSTSMSANNHGVVECECMVLHVVEDLRDALRRGVAVARVGLERDVGKHAALVGNLIHLRRLGRRTDKHHQASRVAAVGHDGPFYAVEVLLESMV